ncbi:uncharacterized protein L969DRAFT_96637 [Mixia osmundae IAM 14324]|uniref:Uncharacterized protein n=1 Tax=Mixia osmundae (strain CBS 9802 / IAM 14324 / JCM 22182 / KY 12970) TaxID=764103 RepID=G7EB13_MIXOS|nr:uncharacterized protein L969DRAFT_96637 [Mixia osmundae IAM 14324]KEI37058.1 hypothetical protein L969DRAFT_96637 [Mixia osmundae IAM 14324]GAB00024.1 hypothetical protein E5Q_06726 [Mixia osmundae IAM 14324]
MLACKHQSQRITRISTSVEPPNSNNQRSEEPATNVVATIKRSFCEPQQGSQTAGSACQVVVEQISQPRRRSEQPGRLSTEESRYAIDLQPLRVGSLVLHSLTVL